MALNLHIKPAILPLDNIVFTMFDERREIFLFHSSSDVSKPKITVQESLREKVFFA